MRFQIKSDDEAKSCTNADSFVSDWNEDYTEYLVDTETNTIVFRDAMEPEDATLGRDLSPLVDLINELAEAAR